MSKKKKVAPAKAAKKNPVKKPAKKAAKPSAKKSADKKPKKTVVKKAAKKPVSKSKPVAKKPVKKAKTVAKVPVKKATKAPVKKANKAKQVAKKAAPVKKVVAKAAPKKSQKIVKPLAKKTIAPPPVKKETKPAPAPKAVQEKAAAVKHVVDEKPKKVEEPTKKQIAEKKAQEVLAITNTIPVKVKSEISASKIASISNSITNPIKHPESYSIKAEKEPNGKFELEFVVHASAEMLYEFISTPSGLSEWFCDDLNIRNGIYTFIWEEQMQQARLLKTVELQLVRFQWVDKTDGSYFEFRIQRDDLTNDISLIVTDFGDTNADRESSKLLWHSQIEKLMHVIGSIF